MSSFQKIILCCLVLLAGYALLSPGDEIDQLPGHLDISLSGKNSVKFLGLSLGHTSLSEAEEILSVNSKRALFISKDSNNEEKMQFEAFFESLFGSDKLVLVLESDEDIINIVKDESYKPYLFPNGDLKIAIADKHRTLLDNLRVESITYLPYRPVDKVLFDQNYGKPQKAIRNNNEIHFLYPDYGLDFIRVPGQDIFQLVEPRNFSRLTRPINNTHSAKVD